MENRIYGDICKIKKGIICHQVNCKRKMGKGLASKIRYKFPNHYFDYMNTIPELGKILITQITSNFYVVGLYSQDGYGSDGKLYTNYDAFVQCIKELKAFSDATNLPIFIPFKIGCGLGGADWEKIHLIIRSILKDYTIVYYDP